MLKMKITQNIYINLSDNVILYNPFGSLENDLEI